MKLVNWLQIRQQISRFPQCHLATHITNHPEYNMEEMSSNDPILFNKFTQIFSGQEEGTLEQLWKNYEQAYFELKNSGYYQESYDHLLAERVAVLKAKFEGQNLIPLEEFDEIVTLKTHKKVTTIEFDYSQFIDLIDQYYKIDSRGYFSDLKYPKFEDVFPKELKQSPVYSVAAAKYALMIDAGGTKVPSVDFWNYILDNEFSDVSEDPRQTLYANVEECSWYKTSDNRFAQEVYSLIRKIFFKEASQLPNFNGKMPAELNMYVTL